MSTGSYAVTEADLRAAILDALEGSGWQWHHETDAARRASPGWPDVYAVHARTGRIMIVQLKAETGCLNGEQRRWVDALAAVHRRVSAACVGVLRPVDLGEVIEWATAYEPSGSTPSLPLR